MKTDDINILAIVVGVLFMMGLGCWHDFPDSVTKMAGAVMLGCSIGVAVWGVMYAATR